MNICEIEAIESRANHGDATSQDCLDLLEHFQDSISPDLRDEILEATRDAIHEYFDANISSSMISSRIEDAIKGLK